VTDKDGLIFSPILARASIDIDGYKWRLLNIAHPPQYGHLNRADSHLYGHLKNEKALVKCAMPFRLWFALPGRVKMALVRLSIRRQAEGRGMGGIATNPPRRGGGTPPHPPGKGGGGFKLEIPYAYAPKLEKGKDNSWNKAIE